MCVCVLYNMRVSVVPYHYCTEADTAVSHSIVFFLCKNTRVIIISSLSHSHSLSLYFSFPHPPSLAHSIFRLKYTHTTNIVVRMRMNSTTTPTIVSVSLKFPGRLPPDSTIEVYCRVRPTVEWRSIYLIIIYRVYIIYIYIYLIYAFEHKIYCPNGRLEDRH